MRGWQMQLIALTCPALSNQEQRTAFRTMNWRSPQRNSRARATLQVRPTLHFSPLPSGRDQLISPSIVAVGDRKYKSVSHTTKRFESFEFCPSLLSLFLLCRTVGDRTSEQ